LISARAAVCVLTALAAGLVGACKRPVQTRAVAPPAVAPKPVVQRAPAEDRIILLPDADGSVGRVTVTSGAGTVDLTAAWSSTRVAAGAAPAPVASLNSDDVQSAYGVVLAALPPAPAYFTLYFRFESDELTKESLAHVPAILQAVKGRVVPEVSIVGHTDTTGSAARNYELGLRRAHTVRALVTSLAVDKSAIEVRSHGEADPLVKTADDTFEPRNRRVEITVR
jgi:outer membrane protein OmpA-like peptidoglycan-associated protein